MLRHWRSSHLFLFKFEIGKIMRGMLRPSFVVKVIIFTFQRDLLEKRAIINFCKKSQKFEFQITNKRPAKLPSTFLS
jgi:hypothetical protein